MPTLQGAKNHIIVENMWTFAITFKYSYKHNGLPSEIYKRGQNHFLAYWACFFFINLTIEQISMAILNKS